MTDLFLKPKYLEVVRAIIGEHYPKAVVWAYGSRAYGNGLTAHGGSDLDLCVKDFGQSGGTALTLQHAFRESNLPFLVDVFAYEQLPQAFQDEIMKKYLVIYDGKKC